MFDAFYLCVVGVVFIIFGLWLKVSIYFDDKNRSHVSKWIDLMADKLQKGETLSVWESINWYSKKIGVAVQKVSLLVGSILLIIGCISKAIN